jgi:hypothetical protein
MDFKAVTTGKEELFKMADERYEASLHIKPDDYRAFHNWGLSLMLQAAAKKGRCLRENVN